MIIELTDILMCDVDTYILDRLAYIQKPFITFNEFY